MFSEVGKALSKCIPDLLLDCVDRASTIDQDYAFRFIFRQLSIGADHPLVKFIRLVFHAIANFFSIAETRLGDGSINVEHESKIGNAIANGKGVPLFDDPAITMPPRASNRRASRLTWVDFPQPSERSNVISGMGTILRQRRAIVERPIFALFGWPRRGKFETMTEAVAADFLPMLAAETPRRSFVVSLHDVAPCTHRASARIIEALKRAGIRTTSLFVLLNYHWQ